MKLHYIHLGYSYFLIAVQCRQAEENQGITKFKITENYLSDDCNSSSGQFSNNKGWFFLML